MLTNTTNVARYLINTTPLSTYSISFPYWDKEEIKVYLTKADGTLETLVEGTNYTLTTPNGVSGTLTRVGDWTAGATNLTIMREMDLTQEVDLRNGDKIDAETLETAFDTATAQIQQLSEAQSRAVTTSVDEAGGNLAIPSKALRAGSGSGTMMGFGPDGNEVVLRDLAGFDADVASAASNASSASASAGTATTQALKSEGYAVGEQNGTPVTSGSPYYQNNSKHYAQVAKAGADVITDNLTAITNLDNNMSDINDVADDLTNIDAVAGDLTNIDSVAGDLTNIDAVNSNKTNIDTVAGIASDVTNVAGVASDIPTVAGVSTDISTVATDISDVSAVAGDLAKVKAVADDLTNIDAVNANKTNIDTVAGKTSEITTVAGKANDVTTVAGIASNVTTVAGKATEVTTVAGIASDVSAVAQVASDVASVADELTDIGTVASNISDVAAVGADIAKVSAVADDLTSINAVYADLANIDAADDHALEAEGWAAGTQNGVPVTSGSPYYENNAKYYGSAVPDLKSAIDNNSNRISNLEEKADPTGAYKTVNYRGTNEVPTGKAKYALVESIVGKSRAWNQLCPRKSATTQVVGDVTWTVNADGSVTATWSGTNSADSNFQYIALTDAWGASVVSGRKYLIGVADKTNSDWQIAYAFYSSDNQALNDSYFGTNSYGNAIVVTAGGTGLVGTKLYLRLRIYSGATSGMVTFMPIIRDLTPILSDWNTSDITTANIPLMVQQIPDLLKYDAYGYSLVDTVVEGVESRSRNLLNPSDVVKGKKIGTNGSISADASSCYVIIGVIPNMTYKLHDDNSTRQNIMVVYYDADMGYLDRTGNTADANKTISTTGNCKYVGITSWASTDYLDDNICFNKSDSQDGTFTPYFTDTLTLPTSVTLRSAGSVSEVLTLESGKKTRPIGEYTFKATDTWVPLGASGLFYTNVLSSAINAPHATDLTCATYKPSDQLSQDQTENMIIGVAGGGQIRARNTAYAGQDGSTFASAIAGVKIYYPLATPLSDEQVCDPVINNTIATEGGGTINTIQTQTTKIDNSLDVGYLAL